MTAEQKLAEIRDLAAKALDDLFHAGEAIAHKSPNRRDAELRAASVHIGRVIELADQK